MENKTCSKCKLEQTFESFSKDTKSKDGKQSQCKLCKNKAIKVYYVNNPNKRQKRTTEKCLIHFYKHRISMNFSRRMRKALKSLKNGMSWEKLVNYTLFELKEHLESLFTTGMTWDNYGEWHIDHKKPISKFKFNSISDDDFKKCWSLSNLQPLWAKDNLSKNDKYAPIV
jgi:hypothetical protein